MPYKEEIKCIYSIHCNDPNITEFYIGSSLSFKRRILQHKNNSTNLNSSEYCIPLYMFINVNGGFENWDFKIIKEYNLISKKELTIEEQKYKELLKPELNSVNAYGYDIERLNTNIKIKNNMKGNCPHCGEEMLLHSIKRHIKRKHVKI